MFVAPQICGAFFAPAFGRHLKLVLCPVIFSAETVKKLGAHNCEL